MGILKPGLAPTRALSWACIPATEESVHKCHSISVLSSSQYELNTKHFLTLLSTVLVKACSVCGPLSLLVIHGEPPARLPLLEPAVIYTRKCNSAGNPTRNRSATNCVIARCQIKPGIISAKLSPICQSGPLIIRPASAAVCAPLRCPNKGRILTQNRPQTLRLLSGSRSTAPAIFHSLKRMYVFVHSTLESTHM